MPHSLIECSPPLLEHPEQQLGAVALGPIDAFEVSLRQAASLNEQ